MAVSKVVYGGNTLVDLTSDTVTADALAEGYTATAANGSRIVGTLHVPTVAELLNVFYPVGAIYQSTSSTSPASIMGGTWERIKDRFLLSAGDTYAAGGTGGSATVTQTVEQLPSHTHNNFVAVETGTSVTTTEPKILYRAAGGKTSSQGILNTGARGGGEPMNNMPPYITVYTWRRIA